ncbi:MAG: transporter [Desulfuromonadales bacterium]|nr:transporter [Desulfuromonadales bacterium]
MRQPISFFLFIVCLCLAAQGWAASDEKQLEPEYLNLSIGTGLTYESGDYGTGSTSELLRVPLIVEWSPSERFGFALEIPFLRLDFTAETVLIGGTPTPTGSRKGQMHGSDSMGTETMSTVETSHSESGLGDITLDTYLTLLKGSPQHPQLTGLLYAKLPTGDEKRGLGSGEFDWGVGMGVRKRFAELSFYAEAMRVVPGTSTNYDPDSYWDWLLSLSYRVRSNLRPGMSLSGGTAPFDGADNPLEVKLKLSGLSGKRTSYNLYLSRGLSDASPDWGFGIFGYLDL